MVVDANAVSAARPAHQQLTLIANWNANRNGSRTLGISLVYYAMLKARGDEPAGFKTDPVFGPYGKRSLAGRRISIRSNPLLMLLDRFKVFHQRMQPVDGILCALVQLIGGIVWIGCHEVLQRRGVDKYHSGIKSFSG